MRRTLRVAQREFLATVVTKGFVLGVLVTPLLIGLALVALPAMINEEAPRVVGEVAVVDPTGSLAERVRSLLRPEALVERREETQRRIREATPEGLSGLAGGAAAGDEVMERMLGEVPDLAVTTLPPGVDLEAEKEALKTEPVGEERARLALVVIEPGALPEAAEGGAGLDAEPSGASPLAGELGAYSFFVREKLDDRVEGEIRDAVGTAIVDGRLERAGLDRQLVERLTHVARVRSVTVSEGGEQVTQEVLNVLLPAGFMILLLVSVMTGGQQLMTTTVEEKSSRVVEVLLSALSPMELMTGKILGQMGVGFVVLALYAALGLSALISFAFLGLVDPLLFVYLVLFYVIAYLIVGSLMAAIGAAVNELREAQALMTPVMILVMIPWILWLPISRDPNSMFATITSFVPPLNCFVMLLRLTSTSPPPAWQVWISLGIGALGVWLALKAAAKVFRVGLLLHGKPPSLATLVRWVRMA